MALDAADVKLLLQQQMKLMEMLAERLSNTSLGQAAQSGSAQSVDNLAAGISEFVYDPQANVTFDSWFRRYDDLFRIEFANQDDSWKVRLLLRKLGPAEHERYTNFILPKNPRDISFNETVNVLSQIFGDQSSLFNLRYHCLKLTKRDSDDLVTYAGIVNRECERFKLSSLTEDQFKCLIFVCGLQSPNDADLRTRLLNRIQQDESVTLQDLTTEGHRLLNLKHDSALVQNSAQSPNSVNTVACPRKQQQPSPTNRPVKSASKKTPPSPCWHCGSWHYTRYCPFKQHRCQRCKKVGHKDGYCQSRTSGSQRATNKRPRPPKSKPIARSNSLLASSKVDVTSRRKFVSVLINGHPARLQLDTASDITIISNRLWKSIGRPPVQLTSHSATSACGGTVQLTGQLHCRVSYKHKAIDTVCYLTDSNLNLLGLDWLEQLGLAKLPITNICNQLQFPTASPPRVEPQPWKQPEHPWSRLHVDFAGPINGMVYLILVDAYSKWPEIVPLTHATTSATINNLRRIFSQHGLPDTLVSDNGSQFSSVQFKEFCIQNNIRHLHSPPYHPQSNGQAERFVDTFKRALLKSRGEGPTEEVLQRFLLTYRTTPNPAIPQGLSPAEALMGRKLRTKFDAMIPVEKHPGDTQQLPRRGFSVGDLVYARDYRPGRPHWIAATVKQRNGTVLYDVNVGSDIWVRHRNQLRPRHSSNAGQAQNQLPLDLLLDTFELRRPTEQVPATANSTTSTPRPSKELAALQPRRWTDRKRKPTCPLQLDPRQRRYE